MQSSPDKEILIHSSQAKRVKQMSKTLGFRTGFSGTPDIHSGLPGDAESVFDSLSLSTTQRAVASLLLVEAHFGITVEHQVPGSIIQAGTVVRTACVSTCARATVSRAKCQLCQRRTIFCLTTQAWQTNPDTGPLGNNAVPLKDSWMLFNKKFQKNLQIYQF